MKNLKTEPLRVRMAIGLVYQPITRIQVGSTPLTGAPIVYEAHQAQLWDSLMLFSRVL